MSRLLHYSDDHLASVHSDAQGEPSAKPDGLWVSVDDAWAQWCDAESYGHPGRAVTEVVLAQDAAILRLTDALGLDEFSDVYGVSLTNADGRPFDDEVWRIDWARVADDAFQGIIIAPYVWERRLRGKSSRWYYGWDVASGCIWDAAAVTGLVAL